MYKEILQFIRLQNPELVVQAPSRINLINPLDAVEGAFWMPSLAINGIDNPLSVFFFIKKSKKLSKIKFFSVRDNFNKYIFNLEKEESIPTRIVDLKKKLEGEFKLFFACVYRFHKTCANFWEKFTNTNYEIGILNTIPRQSGLGGSASMIITILYGLANYLGLYNNLSCIRKDQFPINLDIIAEMATKVEDEDLMITAGYGDRYVITKGGLLFCSYHGKLEHKEISMEPLAVCERIDKNYEIHNLPIIICYSGVVHDSGNVHQKLRALYLSKDERLIKAYKILAEISWKSRFYLMKKDWKQLGRLFRANTRIMNLIMQYAGFQHGIGLVNNILINIIENHPDVYAVKLTGAGGGGSVFALVKPDTIDIVLKDWQQNLYEVINNDNLFLSLFPNYPIEIRDFLKNAQFFKIKIGEGVKTIQT